MFDINTLEGKEIPLMRKHACTPTYFHPIGEAIRESIDPMLVDVYPLHERIEVFQRTNKTQTGLRKVGTLMIAGTMDDWLIWYGGGEFREGVITFFKQDDHEKHGREPDERIWIGFKEVDDPINDLLTEKGSKVSPAEIHEVIVSSKS